MKSYYPPYTVVNRSTVEALIPVFIEIQKFVIVYDEEHPIMQFSNSMRAHEMCDAMNKAHKAGWFDGRAYESTLKTIP